MNTATKFYVILACSIVLLEGCSSSDSDNNSGKDNQDQASQRPVAAENGKFFEADGIRYLYGGDHEEQHFNITDYDLVDEQFHYGIGREKFPALLQPQFMSLSEADSLFVDSARFLLVNKDNVTKAYSIKDLTRHEVVNDEINGEPIMAAYCVLADLGAIYSREMGGRKYTFALSGYTYYDNEVWDGMDGFVLWDRETESLWWPLIGKAVSGPMQGSTMEVLNEQYWQQTTWKQIKEGFADAQVLIPDQDFERPLEWPKYVENEIDSLSDESIAPRWGENN